MSNGRTPEINVTPLIDVLLVLLIIFMVVAPARPGELEAKVPMRPKSDVPLPARSDLLVVTVSDARGIELNGTVITLDELGGVLGSALADRTDRSVIVRAPTGLAYSDVIRVVDEIKGAGAGPIGLQVDFLQAKVFAYERGREGVEQGDGEAPAAIGDAPSG